MSVPEEGLQKEEDVGGHHGFVDVAASEVAGREARARGLIKVNHCRVVVPAVRVGDRRDVGVGASQRAGAVLQDQTKHRRAAWPAREPEDDGIGGRVVVL